MVLQDALRELPLPGARADWWLGGAPRYPERVQSHRVGPLLAQPVTDQLGRRDFTAHVGDQRIVKCFP